jgi:hypothetical protein
MWHLLFLHSSGLEWGKACVDSRCKSQKVCEKWSWQHARSRSFLVFSYGFSGYSSWKQRCREGDSKSMMKVSATNLILPIPGARGRWPLPRQRFCRWTSNSCEVRDIIYCRFIWQALFQKIIHLKIFNNVLLAPWYHHDIKDKKQKQLRTTTTTNRPIAFLEPILGPTVVLHCLRGSPVNPPPLFPCRVRRVRRHEPRNKSYAVMAWHSLVVHFKMTAFVLHLALKPPSRTTGHKQ